MVEEFIQVRHSGHRTAVGERLADVALIDQINDPRYKVHRYEWHHNGQIYDRLVDNINTIQAVPLADGSGVLVLQSEMAFQSDNAILLAPDASELRRIRNPYADFKECMTGDEFWFYGMDVSSKEVVLHVQVKRQLPGVEQDALPLFEAHYDPKTLELREFKWVPWR